MRFRAVAIGLAGTACLLLSGCVGGKPIHYYTINYPAAAVALKSNGPTVVIGRISTPEPLQDGRIRYRAGSNEAGAYEYHRWTERPAVMVQDLLTQALRASGRFRQVQEASSGTDGDYLVRGRLREFSEVDDPGIQTRVSLHLEVIDHKTGAAIWDHDYTRDEPVHAKSMNEVVLSMERNLQKVVGDAASAIAVAAAGPR